MIAFKRKMDSGAPTNTLAANISLIDGAKASNGRREMHPGRWIDSMRRFLRTKSEFEKERNGRRIGGLRVSTISGRYHASMCLASPK